MFIYVYSYVHLYTASQMQEGSDDPALQYHKLKHHMYIHKYMYYIQDVITFPWYEECIYRYIFIYKYIIICIASQMQEGSDDPALQHHKLKHYVYNL
jgi:hypothetical protein